MTKTPTPTPTDRALASAPRDPSAATRELLLALLDSRALSKPLEAALRAIAERATALRMGVAPAGQGAAAEALGDHWFQCPHCADVFEGEKPKCPACEKRLAVARPALEIELGDTARLWLRETPPNPKRIGWYEVDWLRVVDGARWFELYDDDEAEALTTTVSSKVALPPNVTVIGARDGDRTLLHHDTKFDVYTLAGATLSPPGTRQNVNEVAITHLAAVLFPDDVPAPPSSKALASRGHARDPQLELAIAADPDRPDAYLVYADWLQAQGDPRGELIVMGHARQTLPTANLLERHAHHFYGRLADHLAMLEPYGDPLGRITTWRWGYLESLWISSKPDAGIELDEALAAMLDHPSCQFLRELTVGIVDLEGGNSYEGVAALIGERDLPHLRKLVLGDFISEETELNWSDMGKLSPMYRAMPGLRSLTLRSGSMELGKIALPKLEELAIITGGFDPDSLASICNATWPALHTLRIQLGRDAEFTIDMLAPIFDATAFPKVTVLEFGKATFTDDICSALSDSAIAAQLVGLDLSKGTLGDAGARHLVATGFPKLEWIDVSHSYLGEEAVASLSKIAKRVIADRQDPDDGDPSDRTITGYE